MHVLLLLFPLLKEINIIHFEITDMFPQNERKIAKLNFQVIALQIHVVQPLSFKMIHYMSELLLEVQAPYFLEKFLCFLLIIDRFSGPHLL